MLSVIEREAIRKYYFLVRPFQNWSRARAFVTTEAASTDLSGSWDEAMLRRNDVGAYQEASKVHTFIDNEQSKGSYVVDMDGNVLLDVCSTETLPLGHNSDAFLKDLVRNTQFDAAVINSNLDAGERADADYADRAKDALSSVAPRGLSNVTFAAPGNAVEQAIFAAMRQRGGDSRLTALGFEGSHHGNSLALTQFAHPKMSLDLGWPSVKYPESAAQEAPVLESIRSAIAAKREASAPVAAIVIEPTNYQSGYVASESFLSELSRIARESDAALIVDEQGTGCGATGQGFWQSSAPADIVVFGKRTQVAGFFSREADGSRDVNLAGSQLGLRQFEIIKQTVEQKALIEQVASVGKSLQANVERAAEKNAKISGARTVGTQVWIDTGSYEATRALYTHMREQGVLVKLNGARGVMAKPALTLKDSQASQISSALSKF